MDWDYFFIFFGLFFLLAYFLPLVACVVLMWRFGKRSDLRLLPMMVIVMLSFSFIHHWVVEFVAGALGAALGWE